MSTHESAQDIETQRQHQQSAHESEAFEQSDAAKVAAVAALLEQPTPPRFESKTGNFTGLVGGPEDAHRTVGPHRAWSDSSEWCYPEAPCRLCSEPIDQADIRSALADPDAALERVRAEARAEALRDALREIRRTTPTPQSRLTFEGGIARAAAVVKVLADKAVQS